MSEGVIGTDGDAGSPHADGDPAVDGQSRPERWHRFALAGVTAVAVMALGGLVASMWVESPTEVAADTAAPPSDVLTAPVQDTVLSSTVVLPGTFTADNQVSASPVSVAATAGNPGGGPMVVTGVDVAAGDTVTPGRPLIEYSGRPIYALPGAIPAYRDMVPGESGKDIAQLQNALRAVGFSCGWDASGVFGRGTENAVTRFYRSMGYAPPTTGSSTQLAIADAQRTYEQQSLLVRQLETPASAAGSSTVLAEAKQTLQADAAALAQAEASSGPMVPMSEVLFVPQFPAVVQSVAAVGDTVPKQPITLVDGGVQLTGRLDPADAALLKPGMKAEVSTQSSGSQAAGTVAGVGAPTAAPSGNGGGSGGGSYDPVSITPNQPWDISLDGQDARITVTEATTDSPVLAVPEAAISTGADGRTTVTVLDASGAQHVVQVSAGASADGLVAVTPVGGSLARGEQVVVGP